MTLKRFWRVLRGQTRVESTEVLDRFYQQLTDFKAEIRTDHDRIESKLDSQSQRLNQIFNDLSKTDAD